MIDWLKVTSAQEISITMAVRCQEDLLFWSQIGRVFESDHLCFDTDLPCLESDLPIRPSHFSKSVLLIFRLRPSLFSTSVLLISRLRPSHFQSQTFPFFPVSPSYFSKSVLLIFRLSPSHFFGSVLLIFRVRLSHFFGSVLPIFPSQFYSFFESDLLAIFLTVSFWLLPILCSHLIAMCTADKIKDVGVCRKRLHCTTNSLAREINQQNTNRQARKKEK